MPPRKKKSKRQNELDRIAKLSGQLGINIDNLLEQVPLTEIGEEAITRAEIEAESVLFYIETKGKGFQQKICANPNCSQLFLHTYSAVNYCSDSCRAWALANQGLIWNFRRSSLSERWNVKHKGYIPKIIGAEATAALVEAGYVKPELEEPEPEEVVIPDYEEVPYDPNFRLSDLENHSDTAKQEEIAQLQARIEELENE